MQQRNRHKKDGLHNDYFQHVEARPVKCRCSHVFCFQCSENWHDPVRCHLIKKWIKKCDDDSETSNWISANTKECPKVKQNLFEPEPQ